MRKLYGRDLIVTIRPKGLWKLKLAYAIEIGAYLAYTGHYKRSKKKDVLSVARDELIHMIVLKRILAKHNDSPSRVFNMMFLVIGHFIKLACAICPIELLDRIAGIMEVFNVGNYHKLAFEFPKYARVLHNMAFCEYRHELYFKGVLSSPKQPKGILTVKSHLNTLQIQRFKEAWYNQTKGG